MSLRLRVVVVLKKDLSVGLEGEIAEEENRRWEADEYEEGAEVDGVSRSGVLFAEAGAVKIRERIITTVPRPHNK